MKKIDQQLNVIQYKMLSQEQLVLLLQGGDQRAFCEIYDRYWTPLVLHAQRMTKDSDLAQDVVQDLFTRLFHNATLLKEGIALEPYLYRSVRNNIFNLIRHEKIKVNYLQDIADAMQIDDHHADEQVLLKELSAIINAEIDKMPPKMLEIFKLSREQHLSRKQIAEMLGVTEDTVRTQIQRALKILKARLPLLVYLALAISLEDQMNFPVYRQVSDLRIFVRSN